MVPLLWAVHISDGVLSGPWLAGGFAGMVLLLLPACYRVRDEEIPRISLLTAAFFVASLIHIRIGPTSAHLLLNGLVGVVLGRRAGLAIPLGLFLQAVFLAHGGLSSLGVNACVMTLPALAAGALFSLIRGPASRQPWFCRGLVFVSALAWLLCLVFSIALLVTNRVTGITRLDPGLALAITFHPVTPGSAIFLALVAVRYERRENAGAEFSSGLALGILSVLATATLNAAVLLWGGQEDWHSLALAVFVVHLPVAALEGIVLGFTVSFLARVKPEMLGPSEPVKALWSPSNSRSIQVADGAPHAAMPGAGNATLPLVFLFSVLAGLAAPSAAQAHRLEAEYRILPDGSVQIESWFDLTGDSPQGASVQVFRGNGDLLTEGKLNDKGLFSFTPTRTEPLKVVVSAGAGHRKELLIAEAQGPDAPTPIPSTVLRTPGEQSGFADRSSRVGIKDILAGVGFLLGLSAFVLSMRNARGLRMLNKQINVDHRKTAR